MEASLERLRDLEKHRAAPRRTLTERRRPARAREDRDPGAPDEGPKKSGASYIGDVLDAMMGSGHLTQDEVDDAASVVANNMEAGPEAVATALIQKGYVKGSRLLRGGHKKLIDKMRLAMGEWHEQGLLGEFLGESQARARMSETQRSFAERLDNEVRSALAGVLRAEGYASLDIDEVMAKVKHRMRGLSNRAATEATKRGVRPRRP